MKDRCLRSIQTLLWVVSIYLTNQEANAYTWLDYLMERNCTSCSPYACDSNCGETCKENCDRDCDRKECCECPCECHPFWITTEYLYWQIKKSPHMIPLVITGPFDVNVTPTITTPGTRVVLGDTSIHDWGRSGVRVSMGYCFTGPLRFCTELNYFILPRSHYKKSVQSNDFANGEVHSPEFPDNSFLAVPFFDVTTGKQSSAFIAKPGTFAGKATLKINNWMQGAEWNFIFVPRTFFNCFSCCNLWIDSLIGFRYWSFNENLTFTTNSPSTTQANEVFTTKDQFNTQNYFYGGQIGFITRYEYYCISFNVNVKVAFGAVNERLEIRGKLLTNDFDNFGTVQKFQGGFFALPTNIGNYDKFKFAYIPEINLDLVYRVSECLTLNLGYTFFYVSRLFRSENQIDRRINPSQSAAITRQPPANFTGIARPKALLKSTDFWTQGLNVGLTYIF